MSREFSTIGVVGLGTMGAGIAEVFARNGFTVVGVEQTDEAAGARPAHLQHSTDRAMKRGKLTEDEQQAIFDRVTFTTTLADLKDCDLVIEAVLEHLDLKRAIFQQLDEIVRPDAMLATNTSSPVGHRDLRRHSTPAGSSACTSSTRRRCRSWSR